MISLAYPWVLLLALLPLLFGYRKRQSEPVDAPAFRTTSARRE
jgi:Ca-activated chloride channel family protein